MTSARNVYIRLPVSHASQRRNVRENISDTRNDIGWLMESGRNIVTGAKSGNTKMSFTRIDRIEMA